MHGVLGSTTLEVHDKFGLAQSPLLLRLGSAYDQALSGFYRGRDSHKCTANVRLLRIVWNVP